MKKKYINPKVYCIDAARTCILADSISSNPSADQMIFSEEPASETPDDGFIME